MNSARFSPPATTPLVSARIHGADRENDVDLLSILRTLWRGKWLILFVTLCTMALMAAWLWGAAVPLYSATSVVALQNRNESVADLETVVSGIGTDQSSVNTEVGVLRSRGLIDKLVDDLRLDADPEFNPFLREPSEWSLQALITLALGPGEPKPAPSPRVIRDQTVNNVLDALSVENVRQSYLFEITSRTQNPEKSALLADTLADLYIRDQVDVKFQATEQATEWLADRVSQLKSELDEAENAMQAFNSRIELVSPETLALLNVQLKDFRERRAGLAEQQRRLEARVAELEAAAASGNTAIMAEVAETPALDQLQGRLASGDNSARGMFETRFGQILDRAQAELQRVVSQIATMATSITQLERQVADQTEQALHLEQLRREAEASRLIYEYFLGRLKETSVQQGTQQADARVLSYAMLPLEPSSPRKGLLLAVSWLLGVFAGSMIVLLLEMRATAFRTPEEMQAETGTTVIGQIPQAPYSRRRRVLDYIVSKPTSAMVEAVRNLRTSILLSSVDRTPKVIMLTSSMPGEGKTTLSLALAHNLAGMDKRVLVIEGDIRRRTFREFFDVRDKRGLLSAVSEQVPLEEVVYHHEGLGLDILIGERASINAADFFASRRFHEFIERVRNTYDFVVIDTPPVLMVPDARVIAQSADAVVYVVHWDHTPRQQVMQGLQAFSSVNAPIAGLVMSQIDPRRMKRYGYGGSYGQGYGSSSKRYHES